MAILGCRNYLRLSPISVLRRTELIPMRKLQRLEHTADGPCGEESRTPAPEIAFNPLTWKTVDSRSVGLHFSAVNSSVLHILRVLRQRGFAAYLVGGCVRDLLLHKPPKDFDVVTTASLAQVKTRFRKTMTVGRQFPICLVYIKGSWMEVSSFKTVSKKSQERPKAISQVNDQCDHEDLERWENCIRRDFTINSLLYDPFSNTIYDYVNGLNDLRTSKVQTVVPAHVSFTEDCALILRGIRIAARLGLDFSKETEASIFDHSSCIQSLSKARLLMEMNYMFSYGAAAASILLLQRFKLLEILLPVQAAYLARNEVNESGRSSSILMQLFRGVDKLLAVDRPSGCILWLSLLAFHLALMKCPQNAFTIWTFCSILYHGERMKGINFAKANANNIKNYFPEILDISESRTDSSLLENTHRFALLVNSSLSSFVYLDELKKALKTYQQSSKSIGMVFVSKNMANKVKHVFDIFHDGIHRSATERRTYFINYDLLKNDDLSETRFVLGKVIMDTLCRQTNNEELSSLKLAKEKNSAQYQKRNATFEMEINQANVGNMQTKQSSSRPDEQYLTSSSVQEVGSSLLRGRCVVMRHTGSISRLKAQAVSQSFGRVSSVTNCAKQRKNHSNLDRGEIGTKKKATHGGKGPQLSKLFRS